MRATGFGKAQPLLWPLRLQQILDLLLLVRSPAGLRRFGRFLQLALVLTFRAFAHGASTVAPRGAHVVEPDGYDNANNRNSPPESLRAAPPASCPDQTLSTTS